LKVAKLASTKYYDNLPTSGNELGQAFRDTSLEAALLKASREFGIGAQFGGKYFAHDIRVIRLPRHGGSCPIAMALSCSADRNIKAKINKHGIWLEKLEHNPGKFIPDSQRIENGAQTVQLDLNRPLRDILHDLSALPVGTRLSLSGPIVVARDIAHAKSKRVWITANRCRSTCAIILFTTQARRKRRIIWPAARWAPPPADAWMGMSTLSRRRAAV
jgi:fumarate hydratase class I